MPEKRRLKEISKKQMLIFIILITVFSALIYFVGQFSKDANFLYGALGALLIPPMGRESIIPMLVLKEIHPAIIFTSIFLLNLVICFIILTCFEVVDYFVSKSTLLRKAMGDIKKKVDRVERYELVTIGLIAFMFIPFQGTGSIITTIVAQTLRIENWKTVAIVIIGSSLSTLFLLALSLGIIQVF